MLPAAQAFLSEIDPESLTAAAIETYPTFDKSIILAAEALRLPGRANPTQVELIPNAPITDPTVTRMATLFPNCPVANTYLALHYTPLNDLLAVSGDSWAFSKKVLQSKSFLDHQKRLKLWSNSGNAAAATVFAARTLDNFFTNGGEGMAQQSQDGDDDVNMWNVGGGMTRRWKDDVSDYWSLYICALICWAFGHRIVRPGSVLEGNTTTADGEDDTARRWLRAISGMGTGEVLQFRGRAEAGSVVTLVRQWLEGDCLGGPSRLFVDAVGVLRKLEEGVNWKWFWFFFLIFDFWFLIFYYISFLSPSSSFIFESVATTFLTYFHFSIFQNFPSFSTLPLRSWNFFFKDNTWAKRHWQKISTATHITARKNWKGILDGHRIGMRKPTCNFMNLNDQMEAFAWLFVFLSCHIWQQLFCLFLQLLFFIFSFSLNSFLYTFLPLIPACFHVFLLTFSLLSSSFLFFFFWLQTGLNEHWQTFDTENGHILAMAGFGLYGGGGSGRRGHQQHKTQHLVISFRQGVQMGDIIFWKELG
jgi:hypothetical protein